jgi:hypothetical protein
MAWAAHLASKDRPILHITIKGYISAVRSLHVDAGLPFEVCNSPALQRVIRGIKRFQGDRDRKPKLPITLDIMLRLGLVAGDLSDIENAIFDAAKNLAWAGFLRCGEFTVGDRARFDSAVHLTRDSIRFFEEGGIEYMELTIPASKTDPFRGGVTIVIAAAPNSPSTCPVRAMKHLFAIHPLPPTAPLFAKADSSPLRRAEFIRTLKARITAIGLPVRLLGPQFPAWRRHSGCHRWVR